MEINETYVNYHGVRKQAFQFIDVYFFWKQDNYQLYNIYKDDKKS